MVGSSALTVRPGLPDGMEAAAAALYWKAFGAKLGRLLGPEARAIEFLADTLHPPGTISAIDESGELIGVAGVKLGGHGFSRANMKDLWAHYGFGSLWRAIPLAMIERKPRKGVLQMDGICVAERARGTGVGTALLNAVFDAARAHGFGKVSLDVIDTNPRARALYERLGFVATGEEKTGLLQPLLGFASATRMIRQV